MTLERLAERCGVSKSMLSQIEHWQANPTFAMVWNLSQKYKFQLRFDVQDNRSKPYFFIRSRNVLGGISNFFAAPN